MGEQAQLDLAIVGGDQSFQPGSATKARRILPALPRCGSGCSADWDRSRRAARWTRSPARKLVWTRPVLGIDLLDERVRVGALELLQLAPVEHARRQIVALAPQAPRARRHRCHRRPSWPSCRRRGSSSSNRISPSCLGEPTLKGSPASLWIWRSSSARRVAKSSERRLSSARSTLDAGALHGDDHRHERPLDRLVERSPGARPGAGA